MNRDEYNKAIQDLWKTNYNFHEECRLSIDIKEKYITSLEATVEAQEIIIRDKTAIMEAMVHPKTCEGCKWEYVDKFGVFTCKSFQNYNCKRDIRVIDRYEPKAQQ